MKSFYACLPSGEICMTGLCGDNELELQKFQGATIFEGQATMGSYYRSTQGEVVAMPPRPSPSHDFNYTTTQWVPNPAAAWDAVRRQRARTLAESDWRVTRAAESGEPMPLAWTTYRQALRDVTLQSDPFNIVWPVAP